MNVCLRSATRAVVSASFFSLSISAALIGQDPEPPRPAACAVDDDRVEILLLGSYHMSNPGLDRFNLQADDVRTPKRQEEIRSVVEALAEFGPTKVTVEKRWQDSTTLARYQALRDGSLDMRPSETEQIGFRLAHRMGHETVYPIDVRMMLDDEALGPVIGANPKFQQSMQQLDEMGQDMMRIMAEWLASGTIGEMLFNVNRPELIPLAHQPYVEFFVPMVDGDNYAGADMVATWYNRNLRIFANLTRVTDSPDDRIFLVYGAGHIPILKDLVAAHPGYCLEDPLPYLK